MWIYIEEILNGFKEEFSRRAAFHWFIIIVIGIMLRFDSLGVTSIVRSLVLAPAAYDSIIHFFHSSAWSLDTIIACWIKIVKKEAAMASTTNRPMLIGDGVKVSKEGRKMPGVKKMVQESETQSKPEYIFGHMWGCIGLLVGRIGKCTACLPLAVRIQDGLQSTYDWEASPASQSSHVVQIIRQAGSISYHFGSDVHLLLDRYFLSVPALKELAKIKANRGRCVDIITRAKLSVTAYEKPEPNRKGAGRPRKKGEKVKLSSLFETRQADFETARLTLYKHEEEVRYLAVDLLWGQKWYQELRFVLVSYGGARVILVTTDLTLSAATIIQSYGCRSRIETSFRVMKQEIGTFAYHFWSKQLEKLNRFRKKAEEEQLSKVEDENAQKLVMMTVRATEMYVTASCIAMGILQLLAIRFDREQLTGELRYQRTPTVEMPSEANIMYFLRQNFFHFLILHPESALTRIIQKTQSAPFADKFSESA